MQPKLCVLSCLVLFASYAVAEAQQPPRWESSRREVWMPTEAGLHDRDLMLGMAVIHDDGECLVEYYAEELIPKTEIREVPQTRISEKVVIDAASGASVVTPISETVLVKVSFTSFVPQLVATSQKFEIGVGIVETLQGKEKGVEEALVALDSPRMVLLKFSHGEVPPYVQDMFGREILVLRVPQREPVGAAAAPVLERPAEEDRPRFESRLGLPKSPPPLFRAASVSENGKFVVREAKSFTVTTLLQSPKGDAAGGALNQAEERRTSEIATLYKPGQVQGTTADGKALDDELRAELAKKERPAVIARDGEKVDEKWLKVLRPETIVLQLPREAAPKTSLGTPRTTVPPPATVFPAFPR